MADIIVEIDPAGNVKLYVVGGTGESCKALSAPIEKALGIVATDKLTPEFFSQGVAETQKIGHKE